MQTNVKGGRPAAFTLAEVAIAIGIAGIALMSLVGLMPSLMDSERKTNLRSTVPQLTTQVLGSLRSDTYPTTGAFAKPRKFFFSESGHLTEEKGAGTSMPVFMCTATLFTIPPPATASELGGKPDVGLNSCLVTLEYFYYNAAQALSQKLPSPEVVVHASLTLQ